MRVLICGDRKWTDELLVRKVLTELHGWRTITFVIEGECVGADIIGRKAAVHLSIPVMPFPADWTRYGTRAGPLRNSQMLREGKPDLVLAFHHDLRLSKGTKDMVNKSVKAGVRTIWIDANGTEHAMNPISLF